MNFQTISELNDSLAKMKTEELYAMSNNLNKFISVLSMRQVAVEDTILNRLEGKFVK